MDVYEADSQLASLIFLETTGQIESAIRKIRLVNGSLKPDFIIEGSKAYNPIFISTTLVPNLGICANSEHKSIADEARKMLNHLVMLMAGMNPKLYFSILKSTFEYPKTAPYTVLLTPGLTLALSNKSEHFQLKNTPLLWQICKNVTTKTYNTVPFFVWKLFGKYIPDQEIELFYKKHHTEEYGRIMGALTVRNPDHYIPSILENSPYEFIGKYFQALLRLSKNIDFDPVFNRLTAIEDIADPKCYDFVNTVPFILTHINEIPPEKVAIYKSYFLTYKEILKDTSMSHKLQSSLYMIIMRASKLGLFPTDDLIEMLHFEEEDNIFDQCVAIYVAGDLIETVESLRKPFYSLLTFAVKQRFNQLFLTTIDVIKKKVESFRRIDEDSFFEAIYQLVHPFKHTKDNVLTQLQILNQLSFDNLTDPRIRFDCTDAYNSMSVYSDLTILDEFAKLVSKMRPFVALSMIDFFGPQSRVGFQTAFSFEPPIIFELLNSRLLPPENIYLIFRKIRSNPQFAYQFFFNNLISYLRFSIEQLGYDFYAIYKEHGMVFRTTDKEHPWIDNESLRDLFHQIDGKMSDSSFGKPIVEALRTLYVIIPDEKLSGEQYLRLCLTSYFLAPCFTDDACKLFGKVYPETKKAILSKQQKETIEYLSTNFFKRYLPSSSSIEITKLAVIIFGSENKAIENVKKRVIDACEKDRSIAKIFAEHLEQPLAPMKTFLSFIGVKKHEAWVSICQHIIPPSEWELQNGDLDMINELPRDEGIDEIHREAIERLNVESKKENTGVIIRKRSSSQALLKVQEITPFELKPVDVVKGPKIRETEPETLYNVISYLWHSKDDLPESLKPEDLEELTLSNLRDDRLVIGFLTYAYRTKYQLNVDQWISRLSTIKRNLLCIALFLRMVTFKFEEMPSELKQMIKEYLWDIGYGTMKKEALANAYVKESGNKWFFIRSIIGIDLEYFRDIPLIQLEYNNEEKYIKEFFDTANENTSLNEGYIAIIWHFLKPDYSELRQTYSLPSNFPIDPCLLPFDEQTVITKPIELSKEVISSMIAAVKRQKYYSLILIKLVYNIKLDQEEFNILINHSPESDSLLNLFLPLHYMEENPNIKKSIMFYENKPPSFSRAFTRSVFSIYSKPIDKVSLDEINKVLTPVFPGLCYPHIGRSSVFTWETGNSLSFLKYGLMSHKHGKQLKDDMQIPNQEATTIYKEFLKLDENELLRAQPWTSVDAAKDELSQLLLQAAVSETATAAFARDVFDTLSETIPTEYLLGLLYNPSFLNSKNFANVCLILRWYENLLAKKDNNDLIQFCQMFRTESNGIVEDEAKSKQLASISDPRTIADFIHPNPK